MGNLTVTTGHDLVARDPVPADRHPVLVYLAGLAPSSRRVQRQALDLVAYILTGHEDCTAVAWHLVRYQHAQAVRSRLAESYRPATANRMLCGRTPPGRQPSPPCRRTARWAVHRYNGGALEDEAAALRL